MSFTANLQSEIERLESMSKMGVSYANTQGMYGWRNPIRRDTGPLLAETVEKYGCRRILEIGTAHGLSALHLMSGWSETEGRELHTIEWEREVGSRAQELFHALELPATVHVGEAQEVIQQVCTGVYDLIFLDAQKSHYGAQWRKLLKLDRVGPGTVLLADNVIDRKDECKELFDALSEQGLAYEIIPTECGLLKAVLP
jgi:predicted O-methyltransferase YrrM